MLLSSPLKSRFFPDLNCLFFCICCDRVFGTFCLYLLTIGGMPLHTFRLFMKIIFADTSHSSQNSKWHIYKGWKKVADVFEIKYALYVYYFYGCNPLVTKISDYLIINWFIPSLLIINKLLIFIKSILFKYK